MTEIEILVRNRLRIPWDAFRKREEENRRALIAAMLALLDNPPRINVGIASVTSAARRSLRQELYTHTSRRLTEGIDVTYSLTLVPSQADYSSDSEAFSSINSTIASASYGNGSAFFTALQNYSSNSSFVGATGDIVSAPTVDATYTTVLLRTSYPSAQPTSQPTGGPKVVIRTSLQEYFVIINDVTIICASIGGVLLIALVALYYTLRSRHRKEMEELRKVFPDRDAPEPARRVSSKLSAAVLPLQPLAADAAAQGVADTQRRSILEAPASTEDVADAVIETTAPPRIRRISSIRAAAPPPSTAADYPNSSNRRGSVAPEPLPLVRSASRRIVVSSSSSQSSPSPSAPPSLAAQVAMAREASARRAATSGSSWLSSLWRSIASSGTTADPLNHAAGVGPGASTSSNAVTASRNNSFVAPRMSFRMREIKSTHDSKLDAMMKSLDDKRAEQQRRLAAKIDERRGRSGKDRWSAIETSE